MTTVKKHSPRTLRETAARHRHDGILIILMKLSQLRSRWNGIEFSFKPVQENRTIGLLAKRSKFMLAIRQLSKELLEQEVGWPQLSEFYAEVDGG
jgi:hypothetical protein